jgi:ribosome-associated protein
MSQTRPPARPTPAADRPAGLRIGSGRVLPWSELSFRTARSGGPGGQHANKVETQVEVVWDLAESEALRPGEKARVRSALGSRLARGRWLRVRARSERSQAANRRAALERLQALLEAALRPRKARRPTAPTRASREGRLAAKRRQAARKRERRRPSPDE